MSPFLISFSFFIFLIITASPLLIFGCIEFEPIPSIWYLNTPDINNIGTRIIIANGISYNFIDFSSNSCFIGSLVYCSIIDDVLIYIIIGKVINIIELK